MLTSHMGNYNCSYSILPWSSLLKINLVAKNRQRIDYSETKTDENIISVTE